MNSAAHFMVRVRDLFAHLLVANRATGTPVHPSQEAPSLSDSRKWQDLPEAEMKLLERNIVDLPSRN